MSLTQFHLMLNHIPILLLAIGGLMLVVTFIYKENAVVINRIGLIFLALAAIAVIPVFLTGEASEESVEKLVQSERLIERHEEAAKLALFAILAVGAIALFTLVMSIRTRRQNHYLRSAVILCAFIAFGFVTQAAHLGGQIRHTEISSANNNNTNSGIDGD